MLVCESTESASSEQCPQLLFSPLSSPTLNGSWSSPEADDLAQYLDHLLAQAAPQKPKRQIAGGLGRFKAVAAKTKDLVSLKNKAQELDVHSQYIYSGIREERMFKMGCSSKVLQRHSSPVGGNLLLTTSLNKDCLCLVLSICLSGHSQAIEPYFYFVSSYPDVNMYLSNKLFRTSHPPLNLSDSTTQQDTQVDF